MRKQVRRRRLFIDRQLTISRHWERRCVGNISYYQLATECSATIFSEKMTISSIINPFSTHPRF